MQGFALKVRIFAERHDDWWSAPGLPDDEAAARTIFQQILSLAGVAPPSRSTFKLAEEVAGSLAEAGEAQHPAPVTIDPFERLGRRYGAITTRLLHIDAELVGGRETAEESVGRTAETARIEKEIAAIETSASYARPSSLAGALFMMMQTWDWVAVMAGELPDDQKDDHLEPIRRMMAATVDCLEDLCGVPGEALGRRFTGPKSGLG